MLDRVLDELPSELRSVLTLFELEGMTFTDIAGVLEIPRGTVASRLRRGRARLSASDPARALSALDKAAHLSRRVLAPEATVLLALVALNQVFEARRVVEEFNERAPNSPVAPVLRDLVARERP